MSNITSFSGVLLPINGSQNFCWGFPFLGKRGDGLDHIKSNGSWITYMFPRPTSNNTIDSAISQSKVFSYRDLKFSIFSSLKDGFNLIFGKLFSPSSSTDRVSNILSMREPLKIIDSIILRVMINVRNIGEIIGVRDKCFSNKSVDLKLFHYPLLTKHDDKSSSLSATGIVDVSFKNSFPDLAGISFISKPPTTGSWGRNSFNTFNKSKTADFVLPFIANNRSPFFVHVSSPVCFRMECMDANQKVKSSNVLDSLFGKNGVKSCL